MTILQFCRNAVRVAANQDGINCVSHESPSRDVPQNNRADQIQQTESRDHERGGILAQCFTDFLDLQNDVFSQTFSFFRNNVIIVIMTRISKAF